MKSSREQFEAWFNEIMKPAMEKIDIDWPERRLVNDVSWSAWKASRAAIEVELPRTKYYGDHWSGDWALDPELVVDSINEAGLKVKA